MANSLADGLDGWLFLMRTPPCDFALAYFENQTLLPKLRGFTPRTNYHWSWFDPSTGEWSRARLVMADEQRVIEAPAHPEGGSRAANDIAANIFAATRVGIRLAAVHAARPLGRAACGRLTRPAFANILLPETQSSLIAGERIMRRTKPLPVFLFVGISGSLGAPWALAQQGASPQAADSEEPRIEEVVVTGTRVRQSELGFANPVTTFSSDSIERSGKTDLADFLAQTPALVGSTTGDLTAGSNPGFGEVGLNLLNLRHLGVDRTLVLVDGRRHVSGLAGSAAVDIDTIPMDLLQSVDVLTGGASAIYGADGVSGVVNFRLRKDFEGMSFRGQAGTSSEGDGNNTFLALTAGMNFSEDRGNIAIAYEYSADDRVSDQDRDYLRPPRSADLYQNQDDLDDSPDLPDLARYDDVRYADSARNGAVDVDFDLLSDFEGSGVVYDRGFVLENSGGYTQGGSSTPVDGYQGDLFPELDRHLVNVLGHFDVNDSLTISAEGKYVRSHAMSLAQPSFDFYLLMTPDNPYMPDSIRDAIVPGAAAEWFEDPATPDGVLVTRDNYDLGINAEDAVRETLRGVLAANGTLTDHLQYEISYVYGETKSEITEINNRFEDRWLAATDVVSGPSGQPVCRSSLDPDAPELLDGCIAYNIFGEDVRDPAAADWVNANSVNHTKLTQQVAFGSLSGDFGSFMELPGGPIGFAIGAEYRRETSESDPAQEIQDGLTWVGPIAPNSGNFDVTEVFAELDLPVLENAKYARLLSFGAAFRASDYSTVGSTNAWKVDAVYAPVRSVTLRGTYSQAVRAPNIAELFSPESTTFHFIVDPCDVNELNNGTSVREANCATLLTEMGIDPTTFLPSNTPQATLFTEGLVGGNVRLSEETAKTWTAGVVLRPEFAPGLSLSLDWYDIEIEDAINTPEAEELAELCVDQPSLDNPYCAGVSRDPDTGYIIGFTVRPDNVASFRTAGLDVSLDYLFSTDSSGDFMIQLVGGYLDRIEFVATPGAEVDSDLKEQYYPEFSATFDASWTRGPLTLSYGINWFDETDRFTSETLAGDPDYSDPRYFKVKPKWEHDISVAYDITGQVNLYAGVNNLSDEKPEFGYSSYPISAMGRYFYAGAKVDFGTSGQ
jgi:outer membrane receptor protein involved in Fe transport